MSFKLKVHFSAAVSPQLVQTLEIKGVGSNCDVLEKALNEKFNSTESQTRAYVDRAVVTAMPSGDAGMVVELTFSDEQDLLMMTYVDGRIGPIAEYMKTQVEVVLAGTGLQNPVTKVENPAP
jgi:hypothetical protein